MSRRNDDDDQMDSCVFIGTPLADLLPEDVKFSVKPKRPEEQIVTDEKGRQRFHGAFTGGFSAGYFNTVGSKEGWAPASFKSSRSDKAGSSKTSYRPEDFMDEEDFNEYGIAPRGLQIKSDYKDQFNQKDTSIAPRHNKSEFILESLIKPVESTIGVRMLRKMGWREGQGIGPKIKRKLRKLKNKSSFEPGRKIYGVALPPDSESDQEDEELEDEYFVSTYDINDFQFQIKEDVFGLGYKRLNVSDLFGKKDSKNITDESPVASLLFPMEAKSSKKKGITGQSFGFGEYEDEDDVDVYKQDNLEMYDFELNSAHQRDQKKLLNKTYGFASFEDDVAILKKFSISKTKLEPSRNFQGPKVPDDFDLMHKFHSQSRFEEPSVIKNDEVNSYLKSISSRSELLGEQQIKPESVFDLMSQQDREKIQKIRNQQNVDIDKPGKKETPSIPVADDKLKKEKRYETYVFYAKKNHIQPYSMVDSKGMTESQKENEKNEFEKKYRENLKKIELLNQGSRFVSKATLNENNEEIEKPAEPIEEIKEIKNEPNFSNFYDKEEKTDMHKSAVEKKYGKLTRTEYEWRPNPILCKRFNIPNPYKDTKEYGTVKDESEKKKLNKFSLFDIMTAESRFDKGKSKSLFDEINAEKSIKPTISNVKTISLPKNELIDQHGENKIEFESKKKEESEKASNFFEKIADFVEPTAEKTISNENVYLQVRPEFDMFKAIFEDQEDNEQIEEKNESDDENDDFHEINDNTNYSQISQLKEEKTTISSSVSNIDIEKVNRYLDDEKDIIEIHQENSVPEVVKFTQLVKELAKKSSDSTSDSSESSNSDQEIIYEEISISPGRAKKKKEKSKAKKKHHKKKKSKKSHKKK